MCNKARSTMRMRTGDHPPAPHRLAELYIALGGSAGSQWQHVDLPVTSSATPLTKEGNKHPSRGDERRGEKEREAGGRGRENLTHLNLPDTKDNATKTRLTLDREKGTLPRRETLDLFSSARTKRPLFLSSREKLHRFSAGDDLGLFFVFLTRMNFPYRGK